METGYITKDCKSTYDRSKQCYQCGTEVHKAVSCPTVNKELKSIPQNGNGKDTSDKPELLLRGAGLIPASSCTA